jgi:molybdopterin/thiamine biosynthesis adenylyltransferase
MKASIPYFSAGGSVHFRLGGLLTSLDDPDGRVLALVGLLDGRRSQETVWRDLRARYPDVSYQDVRDAITALDESGLLQDASDQGLDFNAAALERWSNNLGFFETYASAAISKYEFQRRIRSARIAVLGVGGVGTHVLIDLVAIGFTDIKIVDFDVVELSNLNRQVLYGEAHLGQSKVQVAAARARAMNGEIRLQAEATRLVSAASACLAVRDRDIVVGSVDGPKLEVMHWLNEGCVRAGAALISGGVDTQRGMLYTVVPGISGCVECWQDSVQASDPTSRMLHAAMLETAASGQSFGEDTAAFNGLVTLLGAHMVGEVVRLASRVSPPISVGRMIEMAFHDPRLQVSEVFARQAGCETCRDARPAAPLAWLADEVRRPPF